MQGPAEVGQIILSLLLIGVILLQTRGSSFGGGMGGDSGAIHHRRRGLERTLFQLTIALAALFVAVAIFSAAVTS
ncbi:MAG: preprotein translocase subunit SecG [Chloroflexota bacterium]|nr:preprotein translocase subunit SecG [Chloroflexota bacterium]